MEVVYSVGCVHRMTGCTLSESGGDISAESIKVTVCALAGFYCLNLLHGGKVQEFSHIELLHRFGCTTRSTARLKEEYTRPLYAANSC